MIGGRFTIPGQPTTKGSGRGIWNESLGRCVIVPDNRAALKKWTTAAKEAAKIALIRPLPCAVEVEVDYYVKRPANHWGTGRNAGVLKDWATDLLAEAKPDTDKLQRALGDALRGIAWEDDALIVHWDVWKVYAGTAGPRTEVFIRPAFSEED